MITIHSLLNSPDFEHNKSRLAQRLNINRETVAKYKDDELGEFHHVIVKNGNWHFYANLSHTLKNKGKQ